MGGKPIVFVICVREPVSQHLSWWRLEQGSSQFASAIGLGSDFHPPPTRVGYPPATLEEAVELSRSDEVAHMWAAAESLPGWQPEVKRTFRSGHTTHLSESVSAARALPDWALPFPNGQLSAFDRFGNYAASLQRWFDRFGRDCFVIVPLEQLASRPDLVLAQISDKCRVVLGTEPQQQHRASERDSGDALSSSALVAPALNAAPTLPAHLEPDAAFLRRLGSHYRPMNEKLFALLGQDLGWHDDPRYWWYSELNSAESRRVEREGVGDARGGRETCGREPK